MKRIPAVDFKFEKKDYNAIDHDDAEPCVGSEPCVNSNFVLLGLKAEFWRESLVYALVLAALALANSFLRLSNDASEPSTQLDAARHLFPHLNSSSHAAVPRPPSALHVPDRPDIQSFSFDLGGTSCACALQWNPTQYWQRVFYGAKYVIYHCTTVFFGVICCQRPQWVFIYKVINEIMEELGMPVVNKFAWTVSVLNNEPKYDTLINDLVLAFVPFSALAMHMTTVLELSDPVPKCAEMLTYTLQLVRIYLQFQMFLQANQTHIWFGQLAWQNGEYMLKVGNLIACLIQVLLLWLLKFFGRLSSTQGVVIAMIVTLVWAPFVVLRNPGAAALVDEQIIAILSFALAGLGVCCYQMYTTRYPLLLWTAALCYIVALVLYIIFDHVVSAPIDRFYYHAQWCGMSDMQGSSASWFACVSEDK
jgi:hypothetical protein